MRLPKQITLNGARWQYIDKAETNDADYVYLRRDPTVSLLRKGHGQMVGSISVKKTNPIVIPYLHLL